MKKFAVISLICIYALATMGFSLKEFYCCGELKTVSFAIETSAIEKCSKNEPKSDNCCKNKFQYFKVKDNHVKAAQEILPAQFSADISIHFPSFQELVSYSQNTYFTYHSHAPPLHNGVPVYLSNCVFTI
ncbi:MAG: hypothetical protein ABIO05_09965 [Ferruginibacter sp.]